MDWFLYCVALVLIALAAWLDIKYGRELDRAIERLFDESQASQADLARRLNDTKHLTIHSADERT